MANVINIGGGAGGSSGGGHTILDNGGTSLTQRAELQFKGAYSEDNSTDEVTEVNVVRSMTKAEFDELTKEEKTGLINVTDVTGGGENEFQPVIYSEEEREIGVWTDGKPLYEKTISATLTNTTSYTIDISALNVDTLVYLEGILFASDTGTQIVINNDSTGGVRFSGATRSAIVVARNNASSYGTTPQVDVTLHYTKTTDQAGSGTWTPQGVPAVHYSTDEHIVGTWIDGSTLYEITLHTTTAVNLNSQTWTQIPWDNEPSNVNRLISAELISVVPNSYMGIRFGLDNGHIKAAASVGGVFPTGIGQTDGNEYVTIRYTKSTT